MNEENPRILVELEVLEDNFEVDLLQLGWEMEKGGAADCTEEEEAEICEEEDVADVLMIEE